MQVTTNLEGAKRPVVVELPWTLKWGMGIAGSIATAAVIYTAGILRDHDLRIEVIENTRFTREDARDFITLREYDAQISRMLQQLTRIEEKLDRISEREG